MQENSGLIRKNAKFIMRKRDRLLFCLYLLICGTLLAGCQEEDNFGDIADRKIYVLAIGNSFSEDAVENYLYDLCRAQNIDAVIGNAYIGGSSLEDHWKNLEGKQSNYEYRKITGGHRYLQKNVSLEEIILNEKWDVITFQQASGLSGIYSTYDPYLTYLIEWCKDNTDAQLWFHQTWAYAQNSDHSEFANYGNDQAKMYNAIVEAAENAMADHTDLIDLIPSGTAVQNLRTSYIGDNMTRDGYHLNATYGRYTVACVWFEKLTGFDVRNNSYYPTYIDKSAIKVARQGAHDAVAYPYTITNIP